jgi:uncharacterized protein (UPF0262 family)
MPARSPSASTGKKPTAARSARSRDGGGRLVAVEIDEASLSTSKSFVAYERAAAIRDLIAENSFLPTGRRAGAFRLALSIREGKLVLDIADADKAPVVRHILSLTPLRRVIKDYFLICDSYYNAVKSAGPGQIEAVDMGRRGVHNEGATILRERLEAKIAMDFETARRLFTLVCALAWKG